MKNISLLNSMMSRYNLELIVYKEKNKLKSMLFEKKQDNNIECINQNEDVSFWFKEEDNIINWLEDGAYLYIYLNPLYKFYESLIVYNGVLCFRARGDDLRCSLYNLNHNLKEVRGRWKI